MKKQIFGGLAILLAVFTFTPQVFAASDCDEVDNSEFTDLVRAVKKLSKELTELSHEIDGNYSISIDIDDADFDCDRIREFVISLTDYADEWADETEYKSDRSTREALRRTERSLREVGRDLNRLFRDSRRNKNNKDRDFFDFGGDFWEGEGVKEVGDDFYRRLNSVRFNRVEGFVLGAGIPPTSFYRGKSARVYGQLGYAFGLEDWRYTLGLESNLEDGGRRGGGLGLKFGGSYYHNTQTNDAWKVGRVENSFAAGLFEYDHFDYYDVEGWTAYAGKSLPKGAAIYVGYRSDDYKTMDNVTHWSLFDSGTYRSNPFIDEGRIKSIVAKIESDELRRFGHSSLRSGGFVEAEFADGMGGDFDFNRYTAEGVLQTRINRYRSLTARGRIGYATQDAPYQKLFTVGGLGTSRGYYQNGWVGTKMLVGNLEATLTNVDLLNMDTNLIVFADAAWVGEDYSAIKNIDSFQTSLGIGLADEWEGFRIEMAFPMNTNFVGDRDPQVWIRFNPTF